jgi:hypothetical protein
MDFKKLIEESKQKEIAALQEEVSKIMLDEKYIADIFTTYTFNDLYRARVHNNLKGKFDNRKLYEFINEKEFWDVPEKFAKKGRCNLDGESLFYCASDFETAVLEVKPEVDDFITISTFKNLHKDEKPRFRIQPIGKNYLTQIATLKFVFENYQINQNQIEIEEFLDELFYQNINCKEDEFKYKLSIVIAKIFFTNGTNVNNDIIETHGLIYSSIIRNKKSHCFVLKPWIVHTYFFIDYIQTWQVLEKNSNMVKIKLVRHGKLNKEKLYPADLSDIYWENPPKENIEILKY